MKKILLPTDFSKDAFNAIKYAVQLFKEEKCIFYLLNTYSPVLYNSEYLINTNLSMDEIYKKKSEKDLKKTVKKIEKEFPNEKHTFKTISVFNTLSGEINYQVNTKKIDVVVMGTKGSTGADQILLGTHTVHAIKKTTCPLLAIPTNFKFRKPANLLFATDLEIQKPGSYLRPLKELAKDWSATINVLHILKKGPLTPEQINAKKALANYLKDVLNNFYTLEQESVSKGILQFQKENSIDLLAMVNQKPSFFESLFFRSAINSISLHLLTPFLVIPIDKNI